MIKWLNADLWRDFRKTLIFPYFVTFLLSYNMSELQCLASENIWYDKHHYDEAEKRFYEGVNGPSPRQQQVKHAHILLFRNFLFLGIRISTLGSNVYPQNS